MTTPEQRARIGRIKAAARALVDQAVDDILGYCDLLDAVEARAPDGLRLTITARDRGIVSWNAPLDTPPDPE